MQEIILEFEFCLSSSQSSCLGWMKGRQHGGLHILKSYPFDLFLKVCYVQPCVLNVLKNGNATINAVMSQSDFAVTGFSHAKTIIIL